MSCFSLDCTEYGCECIDYQDEDWCDHCDDAECWCDDAPEPIRRTWDELAFDFDQDYRGLTKKFNMVELCAIYDVPTYMVSKDAYPKGPTWWTLLTDAPDGVGIDYQIVTEDIWSDGTWGIPRGHLRTDLVSSRDFVTLGDQRWPVLRYVMTRAAEWDEFRISHVFAVEPPGFGWWMPALEELEF